MSFKNNLNEQKCWSCKYYSGKRSCKEGTWSGVGIEVEDLAKCMNEKSSNHGKKVFDWNGCPKYCPCELLEVAREKKRAKEEQKQEERRIRDEQYRAERERKEREFNNWYNSLSTEERRKYDEEQERKAQERKKAIKHFAFVGLVAVLLIAMIVGIVSGIKSCSAKKEFKKSQTGQVASYIKNKTGGDYYSFNKTIGGESYEVILRYHKEGVTFADSGNYLYDDGGKQQLTIEVETDVRPGYDYVKCYAMIVFNWEDLKDLKNAHFGAVVYYGSINTRVIYGYRGVTKGTCPELSSYFVRDYRYVNCKSSIITDNSGDAGWEDCKIAMKVLNDLSNEIFSTNLW